MAFGMEAVIPTELGLPGLRTELYDATTNDQVLSWDLDLAKERRERARIKMASYQQELKKYYNRRIKSREFNVGELVLRQVNSGTRNPADGKLGATWEGPYEVIHVGGTGSYKLKSLETGQELPRSVNIANLRLFYR